MNFLWIYHTFNIETNTQEIHLFFTSNCFPLVNVFQYNANFPANSRFLCVSDWHHCGAQPIRAPQLAQWPQQNHDSHSCNLTFHSCDDFWNVLGENVRINNLFQG